jgi:hypothetical protein
MYFSYSVQNAQLHSTSLVKEIAIWFNVGRKTEHTRYEGNVSVSEMWIP